MISSVVVLSEGIEREAANVKPYNKRGSAG